MSKTQPALLGGLALGVLSALPVIGLGNCCCGAWILMGGGLAAYLLQQDNPGPINVGDGAIVGLLAGIVGAVVWTIVAIPINTLLSPIQSSVYQRMLSDSSNLPPEARAFFEGLAQQRAGVGYGIFSVFFMFVMMFICSFWSMIGGLFGALMFRKNPPPPPPFEPPPPPPFNPAA